MKPAYLAIETGGTKLVAAIADADGSLLETRVLPRPQTNRAPDSLRQVIEAANVLRANYAPRGYTVKGIGFGYGGQVHRSSQRALRCPHEEGWEDVDVRAELQNALNLPSVIENDCKLAALAEAGLGAGCGFRTVFYVTIGTGIGGGIVRDGRVVDFGERGEAEIGHIVVMPQEGFACGCGNKGCLETIASGPGLVTFARTLATDHPGDWKGNPTSQRVIHDKEFTAKDLFEAYAQNDLFASVMLRVAATFTAQALASTIQIVNPDVIVFGGGVGMASTRYVGLIRDMSAPFVMPSLRGRCVFVQSQLGENVVAQGAALLARQTFTAADAARDA
jgi:glucokinase